MEEPSYVHMCGLLCAKLFPVYHLIKLYRSPWKRLGGIYQYSDLIDDNIMGQAEMTY